MPAFHMLLTEEDVVALRRLAAADDRSAASAIRSLIRREAAARGLWTPVAPRAVGGRAVPKR